MSGPPDNPLLTLWNALGNAIPGRPIKDAPEMQQLLQSPFVQDTLRSLVGGKLPRIEEASLPMRILVPGSGFGGPAGGAATSDRILIADPKTAAYDKTLDHEMGHVVDFRKIIPAPVRAVLKRRFESLRTTNPKLYETKNEQEYMAELFTRSLDFMRMYDGASTDFAFEQQAEHRMQEHADHLGVSTNLRAKDLMLQQARQAQFRESLMKFDSGVPGMAQMVNWMREQPIFAKHPYAATKAEKRAPKPAYTGNHNLQLAQ